MNKPVDATKARAVLTHIRDLLKLREKQAALMQELLVALLRQVRPDTDTDVRQWPALGVATADFDGFTQVHPVSHYTSLVAQVVNAGMNVEDTSPVLASLAVIINEDDHCVICVGHRERHKSKTWLRSVHHVAEHHKTGHWFWS